MDKEKQEQAMKNAMRMIAASAKSSRQLSTRLRQKGYDNDVIREVVQKLTRQGFVNDEQMARDIVQHYQTVQPSGWRRILKELKKKQLDHRIVEGWSEKLQEEDSSVKAVEVGRFQWKKLSRESLMKKKKKTYDILIRRGFDFSVAREVVENLSIEAEEP